MQNTEEFKAYAREHRLLLRQGEDGLPIVVPRKRKERARPSWFDFQGPGKVAAVVIRQPGFSSTMVWQKLKRLCPEVELLQGGPPGEWVGVFPADAFARVAENFGAVKAEAVPGQIDRLKSRPQEVTPSAPILDENDSDDPNHP